MPIILHGQELYCAISGKLIHKDDYVVVIPAFPIHPDDPDSFFSDNIALRDEFENWKLKDKIIAKAQKVWLEDYRNSKFHKILVDNEYFFLNKSLIEDRVGLTFLKRVFGISTNKKLWTNLCHNITTLDKYEFRLDPGQILTWDTVFPLYVILVREIENGSRDRVYIPMTEWTALKEILSQDTIAHP